MLVIPVITSDHDLFVKISCLPGLKTKACDIWHIASLEAAEEFLRIEMPELAIIDFSDVSINPGELLNAIRGDSWLLSTGLIGLCDSPEQLRQSELTRGTNIIALLESARLSRQLPQVISIITNNQHMLFHRVIGNDFGAEISATFALKNDALEAAVFTNLICNYLFNINCIDAMLREQLNFVLIELLINAIEHGNCGITYDEKTRWLERNNNINELIDQKCTDPKIGARQVTLHYEIRPDASSFKITDEGDGFDWRALKAPTLSEEAISLHGRGILLSRSMATELSYNEQGNEVEFVFAHKIGISNVSPGLFQNLEKVCFNAGDVVFKEGEPSNYLYYIASGSFEVLINGQRVSILRPEDIFLGEMSFLLNNRRSATVSAITDAQVIMVSKKEFVEGIKEKPHYALFLSRLLARRIERLNHKIGELKV
ncbi:MAG: cyclic nucleotide-binding domain-containing protein [Candidatus Riflebacteria bacterium]|nr:cyclic nucleotide-binding domain-containing protein [Candidatus Riflebacteria bacterium]